MFDLPASDANRCARIVVIAAESDAKAVSRLVPDLGLGAGVRGDGDLVADLSGGGSLRPPPAGKSVHNAEAISATPNAPKSAPGKPRPSPRISRPRDR